MQYAPFFHYLDLTFGYTVLVRFYAIRLEYVPRAGEER